MIIYVKLSLMVNGWYPELLFLTVVFPNSTNFAVVIPDSSVFGTLYVIQTWFSLINWVELHLLCI